MPASSPSPSPSSFQLWIEAEEWAPGEWDPADDVTDAVVTLADGTRWVASFCTFAHLTRLRANCAESGECLGGKYLWASDLILVDDTSRASLEAVVGDLLAEGELRSAFSEADDDEEGDDEDEDDDGGSGDAGDPSSNGVSSNGPSSNGASPDGASPDDASPPSAAPDGIEDGPTEGR